MRRRERRQEEEEGEGGGGEERGRREEGGGGAHCPSLPLSLGRLEESRTLMELLKKFQSCRGYVSSTIQKAEQAIGEQASYLGKDNLQRLIAKVTG